MELNEIQGIIEKRLIKVYSSQNGDYRSFINKQVISLQGKTNIVYISTVDMAEELCSSNRFSDMDINECLYIVDTKSKKMMRNEELDNCYYVDSPSDLNGIVTGFTTAIKFFNKKSKAKENMLLIFDNINTLFMDNEYGIVNKFLYGFFSRVRKEGVPAIIIYQDTEKDKTTSELITNLSDGVLGDKLYPKNK